MNLDLHSLLEQRAEATGVEGDRVPFDFGGKQFTFKDPILLSDEEKDDLAELEWDADVAAWYMGEEQYTEFIETTAEVNGATVAGSSNLFFLVFNEYMKSAQAEQAGKSSRPNRFSRRAAARKQPKQR